MIDEKVIRASVAYNEKHGKLLCLGGDNALSEMEYIKLNKNDDFIAGAIWQMEHSWKYAQGDYLPAIDREVIVLFNNGRVGVAHRPDPKGWDGKNILTGEVKHHTPQTYDNGGWNWSGIKYWLDAEIPKIDDYETT